MRDMPSADDVWGSQLRSEGFTHHILPNTCPYPIEATVAMIAMAIAAIMTHP